jgi:hypothetical protein
MIPNNTIKRADMFAAIDLINNLRRLRTIQFLSGRPGMTVRELSERLAASEHGPGWGHKERQCTYVAIHQHHIPELEDFGAVSRDRDYVKTEQRLDPLYKFAKETSSAYHKHL